MGTINIHDIKLKVQNEQYSICRNPNERVWDTMYSIKDENDAFVKGFVACSYCLTVLKQAKDRSTKNLMTHSRKCTENVTESFKQRRIGNYFINQNKLWQVRKFKQNSGIIQESIEIYQKNHSRLIQFFSLWVCVYNRSLDV
jgi:hypothetical protein